MISIFYDGLTVNIDEKYMLCYVYLILWSTDLTLGYKDLFKFLVNSGRQTLRTDKAEMVSLWFWWMTAVTLCQVLGATVPDQSPWIDVCHYHDVSGTKCCPPGMESSRYLVVSENLGWFEHNIMCE